jgi:predicted acyltransferase
MQKRLVSLDAFRGITIAGMILVNNPGSWSAIYSPLGHAAWHGWTPTDFIFPFFLFIVGVAITLSQKKQLEKHDRKYLYLKILRRTLIIFGLGLILHLIPYFNFSAIRIPGVLQRIAIVYGISAVITMNTNLKVQAWITGGLLIFYWGLMKLIPVPGYGAGDLSVEGNLAAHIDNFLLHGHMWKETWDPEGILSTIPAIATGLSGVLTGHLLRINKEKSEIAGWMFVIGWLAIVVGLFWDIVFPINKALWTSSYVVFTTGAALQFLGFCYFLIDVKGYQKWAYPAVVYGMNAIAVFVLSGLLAKMMVFIKFTTSDGSVISLKTWIYENLLASWASPVNASLIFAVCNVLFWLVIMIIFYKKKIFIKI